MRHLVKWKSIEPIDLRSDNKKRFIKKLVEEFKYDDTNEIVYKAEEFGFVQFEKDGIKCIDNSKVLFISYSALFTVEYFNQEEKVVNLDEGVL